MTDPRRTERPVWADLATPDPAAAHAFYGALLGWTVTVNPDPAYGGYALATIGGGNVAGIRPLMGAGMPPAWSVYIGTDAIDAFVERFAAAGGTVVAPPMEVGDQGRLAVVRDPVGAFIGAWQAGGMTGFAADGPGTVCWSELNARGAERARDVYTGLFGWTTRATRLPDGRDYTTLAADGAAFGAVVEMHPGVPPMVPSYWMVYFRVADCAAAYARARTLGAGEMLAPVPYGHGSLAILTDPQGAMFGLMDVRDPA